MYKIKTILNLIIALFISLNAFGQIDNLQLSFEHYTLENGIEVILQQDTTVENVSVEFWLRDGISYDQSNNYGLAHFFEHVMPFSPLDDAKSKILTSSRTGSNAQVKKDYSRFYQEVKPEGLNILLEVMAGRLKANPLDGITEKSVEFQRERVLAEIKRNNKNPHWSAVGGMAINQGTFGKNHPYASNGYGLLEHNLNFKLEDFHNRFTNIVYANNTILFVIGNFNNQEVKNKIDFHFGNIPSKEVPPKRKIKQTTHRNQYITMKAPHPKDSLNTMVFSWAVPKWGTKEDAALKLLAASLNQKYKEENDFPKSVIKFRANNDVYAFAGRFSVRVSFLNAKDSTQVRDFVLKKIKQLTEVTLSNNDLESAKQSEVNDIKDMQQRLGFQWSRTELLGESLLFTGNPNFYFKRLQNQQKLKAGQVKKIARKWLGKEPFALLFLGN